MSPSNSATPTYTINALKTWDTHDGGGYQGNLLRDGKVVGRFHNDGNGGCTIIDFWKKEGGKVIRNIEERPFSKPTSPPCRKRNGLQHGSSPANRQRISLTLTT